MPARSSRSTTSSETSGHVAGDIVAEPNVVRTPAVVLRSLTAVGTPYSSGPCADAGVRERACAGVRGHGDERAQASESRSIRSR